MEWRRAQAARAAPAERNPPEPAPGDPGPAALLRADRRVVEFTGRTAELAALRAWCGSEQARSVAVLTGAAGAGKTRLALEIATWWQAAGGRWRLVAAGEESQAVPRLRTGYRGRALLVVDHAEDRPGLAALLAAVAADPGPVRLLLVTRVLGEWWERLIDGADPAAGRLLAGAEPVPLDRPVAPDASDADLAEAAVPFLARALSVRAPRVAAVEQPARRMPVLLLHAAALAALLRSRADGEAAVRLIVGDQALEEVLGHEARYWQGAASAAGLPDEVSLLRRVVTAAVLTGAGREAEAAAAVDRVLGPAGRPAELRSRWARWLYSLYPPGAGGRMGTLQPDLLAEALVAAELTADPDLARSCLRDVRPGEAEHAVGLLARAAEHHPALRPVLATALREKLGRLGLPAAQAALQGAPGLGALLAQAIEDAAAPTDVFADIALGLPYPSAALEQAHLAATLRALEVPPGRGGRPVRSWHEDRTGPLLAQLDRHAGDLGPARQAVSIRRELAAAQPGRYRAGLAAALINLAARLAEAGRPADALRAEQEAVTAYREVAAWDPGWFRADLARALSGLAVRYSDAERPADALGAEQEAVSLYRELAVDSPGQYRQELAASLTNLAVWYSESGRPDEAIAPGREAVVIYRELAAAGPGRYRPDLAAALTNLGIWYGELGRPADAVAAEQEAVALRRQLAAADPDVYRADLARSLSNVGIWFSALGRPADALRAERESVALRRELAAADPAGRRPELAAALTNLAITHAQLGHPADALPVIKEAVTVYRELARADPDRYRPPLARALASLGLRYGQLGRAAAAIAPLREAVAIRRKLAAARPEDYQPDLARSLRNLAAALSAAGRPAEAAAAEAEAEAAGAAGEQPAREQ